MGASAAVYVAALIPLIALLPEVAATSFGAGGAPTGRMSREGFLTAMLGIGAVCWASFALAPALMGRLGDRWVNLPNKEHWLAPERRAATLRRCNLYIAWMGALTMAFLLATVVMVVAAHETTPPRLDETALFALIGVFTTALLALCVGLIAGFAQVPSDADAAPRQRRRARERAPRRS